MPQVFHVEIDKANFGNHLIFFQRIKPAMTAYKNVTRNKMKLHCCVLQVYRCRITKGRIMLTPQLPVLDFVTSLYAWLDLNSLVSLSVSLDQLS